MAGKNTDKPDKVYVDDNGDYHNIYGADGDKSHGHTRIMQSGEPGYIRGRGEDRKSPTLPDTGKTGKGSGSQPSKSPDKSGGSQGGGSGKWQQPETRNICI